MTNTLSNEQLDQLVSLLTAYRDAGKIMADLLRDHPGITRGQAEYYNKLFGILPIRRRQKKLTQRQMELGKLLKEYFDANKPMATIAEDHPEFTINQIEYRNKCLGIYPRGRNKPVSEELKPEILKYAATNGTLAASREFDVPNSTIRLWNKKLNVYTPKPGNKKFSHEKRVKTLNLVQKLAKNGKYYPAVAAVAEKLGIWPETIYNWNRKLKIIPGMLKQKSDVYSDEVKNGILAAAETFDSVSQAARGTPHDKTTIADIVKNNPESTLYNGLIRNGKKRGR